MNIQHINKIGLTEARIGPTKLFWDHFFSILKINPIISHLDPMVAIEKAKKFFQNNNSYCLFRQVDMGQHISLIEQGCNCLIIPSTRTENMLTCNSSRFMAEHLSLMYPDIDILNFRVHLDDKEKRRLDIINLAKYFTNDNKIIEKILDSWPDCFLEHNSFSKREEKKVNLLIIGRIYYLFDYRNISSPYINILHKKLNCNILTLLDIADLSVGSYKNAYKKVKSNYPYWSHNIERYWNQNFIMRALMTGRKKIDGVIFVKDPWCEAAREESPLIINFLRETKLPFYLLDFSLDSLSTIDTILESFIEMILFRKRKNVYTRN